MPRSQFQRCTMINWERLDIDKGQFPAAMAAELRKHGINANRVLPTIIDAPENQASMPDADPSRWVPAEDVARVIYFPAFVDRRTSMTRRCR